MATCTRTSATVVVGQLLDAGTDRIGDLRPGYRRHARPKRETWDRHAAATAHESRGPADRRRSMPTRPCRRALRGACIVQHESL